MRIRPMVLCLAVLLAGAKDPKKGLSLQATSGGARHALVIGNQDYAMSPLDNPRRDAKAVAASLRPLGFDVTVETDLSLKKLDRVVDTYLAGVRSGDTSFVYYSGHGMQVDGENYLIPTDFTSQDEKDVKYDAYPLDKLLDKLGDHNPALSVLVLDACRDNPFRGRKGGSRGLANMNAAEGTLIAFATSPGKTAADGKAGGNGVYTEALLKGLMRENVNIEDMFADVRADVAFATNKEQVPWSASSVIGKFCLKGDACGKAADATVSAGDADEANAKLAREKAELDAEKAQLAREKAELEAQRRPTPRVASTATASADTFQAAGHEWQTKPADQRMSWEDAKSYCAGQGGGWRLPDKDELKALYDAKESSAEIAGKPGMDDFYWSSTPGEHGLAWNVGFGSGNVLTDYVYDSSSVRCVR
jgi:uncharacterized caspase-like protein